MLHWAEMGQKRPLPQILNLSLPKCFFKAVLLRGAENQAKTPIHFGNCILGEGQFYALPLMAKV